MVVQDSLRTDLVQSHLKSDKKHRLKQRFDVQRKLGQGTYGKVQLAVNRETGQEVAIKTIKKSKIENEEDLIRIRREIQIMSSVQHPHITHIYEVFENKEKIVLVMQFASGGELFNYLFEKKVLSDNEARRIFRQIASAVYYCHKNKICHRDLKLENVLLDERGNTKITDFGLSNVFDEKNLLNTYCGSPLYASPEIVTGVPYYGPEVDCWSMGVVLYTLVYGAMPFDGSNFKKLVTQISEADYYEPKNKSGASDLIRKLLTVNPSKRATIVDICVDYWVNIGYEHSLLQVAEDMANLTPVRLDLLLALAPESTAPQEEAEDQPMEDVTLTNKILDKDIPDEEEEDEEVEDYEADTAASSFAYMKGSRASQLSISSPNLQEAVDEYEDDSENEFLPADIAALQAEYGFSIEDSLPHVDSLAKMNKKCRSSSSANKVVKKDKTAENINEKGKAEVKILNTDEPKADTEKKNPPKSGESDAQNLKSALMKKAAQSSPNVATQEAGDKKLDTSAEIQKGLARKDSLSASKSVESAFITQRKESLTSDEKVESKKFVRPPGKIIIPKTFDSPQTTPSPKATAPNTKKLVKSESKAEPEDDQQKEDSVIPVAPEASLEKQKEDAATAKPPVEDVNKNVIETEPKIENKTIEITEEKKNIAKGILKKGIAKAKLAERRMSKQNSLDSEVSSSCSTPVSTGGTPEPMPSFYKAPKPYTKEEEKNVMSKAEIKLISNQSSNSTIKSEAVGGSKAPLWDAGRLEDRQLQDRNCNWSTISSTIDSEMSNWREQMEESLRRLSPDDERSSIQSYPSKVDDDKPLVPIARSYKKFTFTKDGACITETKKIYTTPGADGSWTKVEKKTKITTRPGNAEEFEKFRDLHLRTDTSSVTRSDSQSSSGSNEVYDDIFDSWTGDTMMCNMRKMNNVFQKFSRDPFMRRERRRNPFRFFRRTESERNDREKRTYELRSGRSSERESENEEDLDVRYDDNNAVVYGSQGLWQFLRSANRGFPNRVTIQHEPASYGRSMSQDRSEAKCDPYWKRCGSRASSGYHTGTRSQSRDRTESPREKMLRFVFDSPRESLARESGVLGESPTKHEKWSAKRNLSRHNPRRDSGVGSDGYESEYSIRPSPSDEMSRTGRVSSLSSVCSDKQGAIRNFMKSWSKSLMSPPISPSSMGSSAKEQRENMPEARKHRVEQWLDMNAGDVAFGMDHPKLSSRKSSASHGSSSPSYATMRPREYFQYNRSSSDKLSDCTDFFPSFDDNPRRSLNKDNSHGEMGKVRFRSMAYSPVSEESFKDTHSAYHSDGSHSGSSVHRINFTISDGRMPSSHGPPQTTTRYIRQFSSSKDGSISVESTSPTGVRVEQISGRSPTQPVVQMRVSISRGNRENPVISSPPHASKGLWEQQESSRNLRQDIKVDRSPSPVPGIRQFSTEVQHCIGGNDETPPQVSLQCGVSNPDKQAPHGPPTGKSSPFKIQLPAESSIWGMACPPSCMDSKSELTNNNKHDPSESHVERYSLVLNHRPKNLPSLQSEYDPGQAFNHSQSQSISSNGANTPDSLEDLSVDPVHLPEISAKMKNGESYDSSSNSVNGLHVDVKPLGVLWGSCNSKTRDVKQTDNKTYVSYKQTQHSRPSSVHSDESGVGDKQRKCLEKTSAEIGSIWNQKNSCQTFDLLKNLLSDDGLDSFSSSKCVLSSSHSNSNRNNYPDLTTNNENTYGQNNPVLNEKRIAVIDNIELEYGDKFHKMPSLMDDLQSPKEVLRQAMKICESLNKCN